MKKLIILFIIFLTVPAFAGTWCQWDGSEGTNCRVVNKNIIKLPSGVYVAQKDFNSYGYYELITVQPEIGENQIKDQETWEFVDNQIIKSWIVRDMTQTEIDDRIADPMNINDYYQWKALIKLGIITQQQAADNLPPELIDAYLARKRLLGD